MDIYACGHIHNFQHIRVPGSDIDYVVNTSASLSRKVKAVEGTQFCSPEPGFSIFTVDKKELDMHMVDKTGKSNLYGKTYEIDLAIWGKRVYLQHNVC